MPVAKEAALQALAIDDTVADAHVALGMVLHLYEWDWSGAEREYRRALDLNPGDTFARVVYAELLGQKGRAGKSVAEARAAVERDPLSLHNRHCLAQVLWLARQFDASVAEVRTGLELDRAYYILYWDLGVALLSLGRHDEGVEALRQATSFAPGDPGPQACLGWALWLAGHRQEAFTILEDLERRQTQEFISGFLMALVSVGLGESEQAISWLQKAAEERDECGFHTGQCWSGDANRLSK